MIEKNTIENLVIILAGILFFNGLVHTQWFGPYVQEYPTIVIGVAVLLIIFKDKIAQIGGG